MTGLDTKFVNHEVRVMKNVTISMDDATLAWVRVKAAESGKSVSRWIGEQLASDRARIVSGEALSEAGRAMDEFLAHPGWDLGGEGFDREEIYDDRLRRLERGRLQSGPSKPIEASQRAGMAEAPRPFRSADDESSGSE